MSLLGPGIITGASDDDPSGIGTYSQAGAAYGFSLLWSLVLCFPLMVAVQEISGRIGRVTGRGIASNIRRHYPAPLLFGIVACLVVANTINLGADLGAMASSLHLLIGGPVALYIVVFAVGSALMQIYIPYTKYVNILKWLTLSLLAYAATLFCEKIPWGEVGLGLVTPRVQFTPEYVTCFIAVLGTTISPYLFFWQAAQEREDVECDPDGRALNQAPEQAKDELRRIAIDTRVGMAVSNIIAFCIVVTAAVALHAHGQTDVATAEEAARALEPVAGKFAFLLFALGIIGTGLLAIPVLAGSSAYAVGEAMHWRVGLEKAPHEAKRFYGVIALSTFFGIAINLVHIDPIKALFWSAVINGVVAVPVMVVLMFMAVNRKIMGDFPVSKGLWIGGWAATIVMTAAAIGMFVTMKYH